MAEMTIKKIAQYLDKIGWRYRVGDDMIETGFSGQSGIYPLVIGLQRRNNTLLFMTQPLAKAKDNISRSQLSELLEALLNMNYTLAIGCFERDSSDGEIRFRAGTPTEDGGLTFEQFRNWLMASCAAVDRYYPELQGYIYGKKGPVPEPPKGPRVEPP